MYVDEQGNIPEVPVSGNRSFSSNHQYCSQSRKISIGVLVGTVTRAEAKDIKEVKEAVIKNTEMGSSSKGNCVKDPEQRTPDVRKHGIAAQDTSPWVSTRTSNQKASHAAAVRDTEHTPIIPATRRPRPRSKLSEKASAAHSVKFFAGKADVETDECRKKKFDATYSTERGQVKNAEHLENSTEPEVMLEKDQVGDKTRKQETGGRESLRTKLWKVLGNVSSPNSHCSGSQSMDLHPHEGDEKQSPIGKKKLDSDTIESDSETPTLGRPMTRSLARKRASTQSQHHKTAAPKSTSQGKEFSEKTVFPSRVDSCRRLYDHFNDFSLPLGNKNVGPISRGDSYQVHKDENAKERQQSENKRSSVPAVDKSIEHGKKGFSGNRSNDRGSDAFVEPKSDIKKKISLELPLDAMAGKHKKDKKEDKCHSLLQKKRNSVHKPSTPFYESKSHKCLPEEKQEKPLSPAKKSFNVKGIRSFKSLLSSIPAERKPNTQVESPNGGCELNYSPLMKPSFIIEDGEDRMSKSSTDATDSESLEDDPLMKDCREPNQSSPEISTEDEDDVRNDPNKNIGHKKGVEMTGCRPVSESLKGIQDSSKRHEDGLASIVSLFAVTLGHVKAELKSVSNKRSAEILRAASENIFVLMQDAESKIKTDVGKLNNLSQMKRKRMETKFQEQQEQLLGMHKKFKEEVDQHLQGYSGIIEDIEKDEVELKRRVERQRAAHRRSLSQVEQEIKTQLDDAEGKIKDVQELAKKKMLQLKLVVAESVKQGVFG